jgi:hypothetical protein
MKLMIWWAQRLGDDGVARGSLERQRTRWGAFASPEIPFSMILPEAASSLAATLPIELDQTQLSVRNISPRYASASTDGKCATEPVLRLPSRFRTRAQAERFLMLICLCSGSAGCHRSNQFLSTELKTPRHGSAAVSNEMRSVRCRVTQKVKTVPGK